jgi:type I restriction enzyme S subunit
VTAPAGWKRQTLGELGRYLNGRGFKKQEWRSAGRPIIRIQNLTGSSDHFNYFEGEADDRHVVHPGDLLVSWAATLGAHIWNGPEAVLNQHIFKVESYIDLKFHKYLLDHKLEELMRHTHGSGMVHITRGRFDAVPVDVPPIEGQRRIVDLLEDHLSRLDAADEYLSSGLRRAEVWYGRLLAETLWATDYPRVRVEDLLREPMRNGRSDRAAAGTAHGTRTLTLTAVTKNAFTEANTKMTVTPPERARGLWLEPGDVFVQRSNTPELVGTTARYDGPREWAIFPDLLIRLRADESKLDSRFLAAALQSKPAHDQLRRKAKGLAGSMPKIDQSAIASTTIPVPSLDDQLRLLGAIRDAADARKLLGTELALAQRRSRGLRRALLESAFSGRLTSDHPPTPDSEEPTP